MKVFYESKLAKWLLWQGYSNHHIGMLRLHQEKQGGDEAEYT